ncbi:MAG TPA: glycosyl hydrolase family 18 protein [Nannocystaceae bacterium]|nr:glycosyl hydrolase family 18 protein [Nannocystaceae bacterium]
MAASLVLLPVLALASVHGEHARTQPRPAAPVRVRTCDPPEAVGSFSASVYGYYAYWLGSVADLPWDRLTHVAIFSVDVDGNGNLSGTEHWTDVAEQALALAEPYGVHLHLAVTSFDAGVLDTMLSNPSARATAVDQLGELVEMYGGHGVAVDFEGMDAGNIGDLTDFVEELAARVGEVSVATPAVDWAQAYDYPQLAAAAQSLFIMGYDYHWRGGDPGPVAPLFGGGAWGQYALEWSVADYLATGVPPEKIVLGLPLYGYTWPTVDDSVPGVASGDASSILFSDAKAEAAMIGAQWDDVTHTPYYFPNGNTQTWYDDAASLDDRIAWAIEDQALGGIGFWALNYDGNDPELWDMVKSHTQIDEPDPGTTSGGDETGDAESTGDVPDPTTSTTAADDSTTDPPPDDDTTAAASDGTTGPMASGEQDDGCGCAQAPGNGALLLLLLPALRRRRASVPR